MLEVLYSLLLRHYRIPKLDYIYCLNTGHNLYLEKAVVFSIWYQYASHVPDRI